MNETLVSRKKQIQAGVVLLIAFIARSAFALTANVEFSAPPPGAQTWVFIGDKDCGVDASGIMLDKTKCPYGQIGAEGATSVAIGNIPPGVTIYATAYHYYPATGIVSNYAKVVSSAVPPLPSPTEPIPFPAPIIIQWPGGNMTITHSR